MSEIDPHGLWLEGRKLSAEAASALESGLAANPDDVRARVQLLGYYSLDWKGSLKERDRHALWLIAHHPELDLSTFPTMDKVFSPDAHAEASRLWRSALEQQPENPAVLKAASGFFSSADRAFAKELLRRGAVLEPDSARWHQSIGNLLMLDVRHDGGSSERVEAAREALVELQRALELEPSDSRRYGLMIAAAEAAFFADDHERATAYAEQLLAAAPKLDGTWIHGKGLHHAHIVLGRVALARDDMQLAKEHLLASVHGPTSPQLGSFGPDQSLALALLARGERAAVLAYADACKQRFGGSLGLLGSLFRPADGEGPRLQVVRDRDDENH